MSVNSVLAPYPSFFNAAGAPLENGMIYIGEAGFEARTTPKASFFDVALTIPTGTANGAAIRTKGGFPVNNSNAPAMFYVDGDFSISVCDRNGVLLYSALSATLALNVGAAVGPVLWADGNLGAVGGGFANEPNTGLVRSGAGIMQTVVGGVLVAQQTNAGTVFPQPVSGAGFNTGVLAVAQPLDADLTQIAGLTRTRGDLIVGGAAAWADLALGAAGTVLVSDGTDLAYGTEGLYFRLNSASVGSNATGAQNVFPVNVTLDSNTVYECEVFFSMSKTVGTTNHFISFGYGGTATINNILRYLDTNALAAATVAASVLSHGYYTATSLQNMTGLVGTATSMNFWIRERFTVSVNVGGTFIPQYSLSAAPGGAYSTNIGSFFRLRKIGAAGANNSQGSWA